MRFFSGTIAALMLMAVTPSVPHAAQPTKPAAPHAPAVDVTATTVPAARAATTGGAPTGLVAELPASRTDDFSLVGVTWEPGFDDTGMKVQVRLRTDGTWSGWRDLDVETDEGEGGRDGTEPFWAGNSDGVAVRVMSPRGERPVGLTVSTIDPGTTAADASAANDDSGVTPASDGSPTYTPKPTIISRAAWGAKKNTYCDAPRTGNETRGVIVHHTAGSNTYSESESASIVRATQIYHMSARGWCDIGYNFLVDRYGNTFEGRNGGVDRPVRGAHAGTKTVNTYTMGVSMMGTFTATEPSDALKASMVKLIGWRLGTTFHHAVGHYSVGGLSLNRIAGHRNVVPTACPGAKGYSWLSASGGLRDRVAAYIDNYSSTIKTRAHSLGVDKTGLVYVGEYPFSSGPSGRKALFGSLDMYSSSSGTYEVAGYFRTGYNGLHAQSGVLGVPVSESQATSLSTVTVQRFADGTIYRVSRGGHAAPYALWADLEAKYADLGEASGALGAPTKGEASISGGRKRAYFDHGHMTLQADNTVTVTID